jgi:O-antigen/teichoic acid export membrane protein
MTRTTLLLVLSGGLPFFVWQAALMVYGQIDLVILSVLTNDAVVGWYGAAYRLIMLPAFTPIIVTTATLPALSALSRDPVPFGRLARRSVKLIALATVPMAFGILMLPDKLIGVLGYPDEFANSIVPIMLLSLHVPLAGIDMVIGTVLITVDRQRQWAVTAVAAAIINPAANLVAIPVTDALFGNGAIGAAFVTTLTELFMLVVGLRLIPKGIVLPSTFGYVGRCICSGLIMSAAVFVARDMSFAIPVTVGVAAYAGASFALRTLTVDDLKGLVRHLLSRGMRSGSTQQSKVVA